jgi:hypothetical protein
MVKERRLEAEEVKAKEKDRPRKLAEPKLVLMLPQQMLVVAGVEKARARENRPE